MKFAIYIKGRGGGGVLSPLKEDTGHREQSSPPHKGRPVGRLWHKAENSLPHSGGHPGVVTSPVDDSRPL